MQLNATQAQAYLNSELQPDAEPALSTDQKTNLLSLAETSTGSGEYTYRTLATSVYLGFRWKRAIAVETHKGDEDKIFEHLDRMIKEWAWAADNSLTGNVAAGVFAGGISKADIDARNQDSDRVKSAFSTGLHREWGNNPALSDWN